MNSYDAECAVTQATASVGPAGIGDLYEAHRRKVYGLCLRMTRNSAEAEDLTQEVFVQLLRKIGTFRGESLFTTWLYRLTVNQVLMHIRHAKYRKEYQHLEIPFDTSFSITNRPSSGVRVIEKIALEAALEHLPSGCKSVFLMYDIEGYKHHEIASAFGCSVGNSKSQLHKARKKLKELLETQ